MRWFIGSWFSLMCGMCAAQQVDWMVGDEVGFDLNPAMPEHRIASSSDALVTMRSSTVDHGYGSKVYGVVAMDARDPGSGELTRSCLLGDSVAVSATVVGEGVAYFAGRFRGDALAVCDGTLLVTAGGALEEEHFILAWDLATGDIRWSRNISVTYPECEDIASLALDPEGRLWYAIREHSRAGLVRVDVDGMDVEQRIIDGVRNIGTMSFDPWGGLHVSGSCENGALTFGGQTYPVCSENGYNMFVLRYRPDGSAGFAEFAEDVTFQDPTVVATTDGHAYFAGSIFMPTTWGEHTVEGPSWGSGVFIARLDTTGTFDWVLGAQSLTDGITGDIGRADGPCIAVDANDQVYFLGVCRGLVHWGGEVNSGTGQFTDRCMTLLAVDSTGIPRWALTSEPTTWGVEPQGITAGSGDGSVHFAVHSADPFQVGGHLVGAVGQQVAAVGRVGAIPTAVHDRAKQELRVWPIPAAGRLWVEGSGTAPVPMVLVHATGQVVRTAMLQAGTNVLDVCGLAPGVYLLRTGTGAAARVVVE